MDIRAAINEKPRVAIGACLILLACVGIIWHEIRPKYAVSAAIPKAFYSDDDGATWFADDAMKPVPFGHDGKPAYLAKVFRCSDGKPFVAYLAHYSDADNARLTQAGPPQPDFTGMAIAPPPSQVKRPGKARWIGLNSGAQALDEFDRIIAPTCPDGGADRPTIVRPTDPDNGSIN